MSLIENFTFVTNNYSEKYQKKKKNSNLSEMKTLIENFEKYSNSFD